MLKKFLPLACFLLASPPLLAARHLGTATPTQTEAQIKSKNPFARAFILQNTATLWGPHRSPHYVSKFYIRPAVDKIIISGLKMDGKTVSTGDLNPVVAKGAAEIFAEETGLPPNMVLLPLGKGFGAEARIKLP